MRYADCLAAVRGSVAVLFWGVAAAALAAPAANSAKGKPIPPFADVEQTVAQHFESRRDYQSGDLITKEAVAPLLAQLQKKGFPLADAKQILEQVPGKGEFLVDQLSTPGGRTFMRRIVAYPDAYDRLDRLSRLPHGEQTVRDLIRNPGGEKMVRYMTTAPNAEGVGKLLSNSPSSKQFTVPTGRIYTVAMLLARLQQSHAAALKAAGGKK
jgi:hypothetical protein